LAQRHLGLEAQPFGAPVAQRTGEKAAGDGAEENGEVLRPARDQAVGKEPRSGAESGSAEDPSDGKAENNRRGSLQKMPCVLLDDALVQIFHPHSPSAPPRPILSPLNEGFTDSHLAPNQVGHSVGTQYRENRRKHT